MISSLAVGYVPTAWSGAWVVYIPKARKKDPRPNPKSFRPFSLTYFLLKTIEKLLDYRIRSTLLKQTPLQPTQRAYRAGRSTDTALYQIHCVLRIAVNTKEVAMCAFLHIEGSFDNAAHNAVQAALARIGLELTTSRWIFSLLRSRQTTATVQDSTVTVTTPGGCPRGGVLSPLLWSLMVDELLTRLASKGIQCQGYADDIVIIAQGKFKEALCDIIQLGLRMTSDWLNEVGLNLNPAKTVIVRLTKRYKLQRLRQIIFSWSIVAISKEAKYLGVTFDSKLNFGPYVSNAISKCSRALNTCFNIAGKSWGTSPKIAIPNGCQAHAQIWKIYPGEDIGY